MQYRNAIIDFETLGLTANSVALQLGAVAFNLDGTKEEPAIGECTFLHNFDIQVQINAGRTISRQTLQWWLEQSDAARSGLKAKHYMHPATVLDEYNAWWRKNTVPGETTLWCRHKEMDIAMLNTLCEQFGRTAPHHYRKTRDVSDFSDKTDAFAWAEMYTANRNVGVAHNALYDCIRDAALLIYAHS